MKSYTLNNISQQKYLFFTGKGGVGKTSIACATAISLADSGENVLLISTDPASNLQDVFEQNISQHGTKIKDVPRLTVVNLDPVEAAEEYKESVVAPYRGQLPESAIKNMEEQLSGSCTVEIAAFNQFSDFLTDEDEARHYDHIIFDTAPTGHTLRMLQLPSAWSSFIKTSKHGASCLGQLSGLEERKDVYKQAVMNLADGSKTRLVLVSRPEEAPLKEAARSSYELRQLGICNQLLVINGLIQHKDSDDALASSIYTLQQEALAKMPEELKEYDVVQVPLRSYNLSNIKNVRKLLTADETIEVSVPAADLKGYNHLDALIDDIFAQGKRVIFTMGKGGVGKTTIATEIALGLKKRGASVHLTTTDPANHINYQLAIDAGISVSKIDEQVELEKYKNEVRRTAREAGVTDFEYIEEDLRSPCTQEIAVFRTFADIVEKADEQVVVIDTAPTGHALLLLDSTQSYDKQIASSEGDTPESVKHLLPRLRDEKQTEVVIVTLPEATPVFEAQRLQEDLQRAGIKDKWWVVNQCLALNTSDDPFFKAKASEEIKWIEKVNELSQGNEVLIEWKGK
ncbi:MAG: arsenical pump-driving ATPase [Prevotella sp.]|jgi:arsenite-transporting ATPase|nr:arsenical pump-driving ATPase [Prevotella sp.]MCH3995712.1 arsenical pump-driving ATPase [Prevotella sp.]